MSQQKISHENGEKITYWRSIDKRTRTLDYLSDVENEFRAGLSEITEMDRRTMLKVMGASVAISGLGVSCRRPEEKILPYVRQPEDITPGLANFYATAQPTPFGASGIIVESHEGRPTKVEGNKSHPANMGAASFINQASVLEIYDPDRSRFCSQKTAGGRVPAEWLQWDSFAAGHFFELQKDQGQGLAILCDSDLSPTFLDLKEKIKNKFTQAKFYVHEPMRQKNIEKAASLAFGQRSRVLYNFDQAKIIATVFSDPFSFGPDNIRHNAGFSKNRAVMSPADAKDMNRLYAIEADFSLAGTNADHRLALPVAMAKKFVEALAYELLATWNLDLNSPGVQSLSGVVTKPPSLKGINKNFLLALAKDLAANKGAALIYGGEHLPHEVLALINLLNIALQGHGKVFDVVAIDEQSHKHLSEPGIVELNSELKKDQIQTLIILGVNPVYDAPAHLDFSQNLLKAKTSIHLGQRADETGMLCHWHLPQTHFLEHFADTRSYDGTISIIQPLIKPLHNARSTLQLLAQAVSLETTNTLTMVQETFKNKFGGLNFEKSFNQAIHDGLIKNSAFGKITSLKINSPEVYAAFNLVKAVLPSQEKFELVINFDRKVLDGRLSNHSWMQELPDPVTKINWDNALLISPKAAKKIGIKSGVQKNAYVADVVMLKTANNSVELPVFVMPGLSEFSLVTTLGYGRTAAGEIGNNVGVNNYPLITDYQNLVLQNISLERLGKTQKISSTQEQFAMNGDVVQEVDVLSMQSRDPARLTDVADFVSDPKKAKFQGMPQNLMVDEPGKKHKVPLQITKPWNYATGNQWGMVIDLAKCTGCNACITACQAENNIPVVGREQVIRGRMMHWMRVDRYFVGDVNSPKAISQPVTCQHCENAPCEPVCPVAATSHDKEGLNVMTYNRCIGTRYCANNCPYKVRRFNYFDFSNTGNLHVEAETKERMKTLKIQRNPDVTVRYRGVMEKCTYCTQRIQESKMQARRENRDQNNLPDGTVTPACAQTCPSQAIVFGNINDEKSRVGVLKNSLRNYTMLDILNTRPRTSYLSKLRNPNPLLVA